jgi:SP family galactose:H+ symporter-like MFS transporter
MLTLNQLMQSIGMLTAYVVNLVFSASGDWRAMFWVGVVPAVVLALGATRLPESPSWLAGRGRTDEAREVLGSVAGAEGAEQVIERYRREDREQRRQRAREREPERQGWRALLTPRLRPAVVVGLGLAALQQFVGINTVVYYAPTIMERTGLTASNSIVYSVIIGAVGLVMTIVSLRLIDRVGRRPLLSARHYSSPRVCPSEGAWIATMPSRWKTLATRIRNLRATSNCLPGNVRATIRRFT